MKPPRSEFACCTIEEKDKIATLITVYHFYTPTPSPHCLQGMMYSANYLYFNWLLGGKILGTVTPYITFERFRLHFTSFPLATFLSVNIYP
jgi:hypothetical protein